MALTEDDLYRTSTQYRLWSYTEEALASLRRTTNALAADRVRAAINRLDSSKLAVKGVKQDVDKPRVEVDCLTQEEEQKLVGFYCLRAIELADFCDIPTNTKATAVQYLKRFYLSNSPMTYHPKQIMPTALFLAGKSENTFLALKHFVAKLPKTTAEDVAAPEFLLMQGLRFTLDVRHPHRGLEGGFMELMAIASGNGQAGPSQDASAEALQLQMMRVESEKVGASKAKTTQDLISRIQYAHGRAKDILKTSALLSDAYLLYTPAQIWLSSLLVVDEPLAMFYLDIKLPSTSGIKQKLTSTVQRCASLLRSSVSVKPGQAEMKELTRIDKKLYKCRNPEKVDLVAISNAQKRDAGGEGEKGLDEKIVKKRKLERENSIREAEALFGPSLNKSE